MLTTYFQRSASLRQRLGQQATGLLSRVQASSTYGLARPQLTPVPIPGIRRAIEHQQDSGLSQSWNVFSPFNRSVLDSSILFSKDDKPPPKGFEKFFKKRNDNKEVSQKEKSDEKKKAEEQSQEETKDEEEGETPAKKSGGEESQKKEKSSSFMSQFNFSPDPNNNHILIGLAVALAFLAYTSYSKPLPELLYSQFYNDYLLKNQVKEICIKKDNNKQNTVFNYRAEVTMIDGQRFFMTLGSQEAFLAKLELVQVQMEKKHEEFIPVRYDNSDVELSFFAFNAILLGLAALFFYQVYKGRNPGGGSAGKGGKNVDKKSGGGTDWFGGGGRFGSMNKANINTYGEDKKIDVRFKDVAGNENAKEEVVEFVDFLKNPKKYQALGARVPRGALLVGPPGTGKTLLAKAVAGEAGVPFLSTSGSEFVEMFVGVGASRVRDLFKKAREKAPSIVFIDEIDAVGKKRHNRVGGGGNEEQNNTLNQLLVEMDGFATDSSVIVLAATNRSDSLDNALLRPGRFDRQIEILLPTIKEREKIFKVHLKSIKTDPQMVKTEYARKLSALTPGFSGADIMNICNEGAIIAARKNLEHVSIREFEQATERVIGGIEKKLPQSDEERRTVAYHESGHAVAGWFSEYASPLIKLTIIPRAKGSLGFAQYLPDELTLYTQEQLEDMIKVALGGRISEEIFFQRVTTGASDDFKKCAQIAHGMVTEYGLSPVLGTLNYAMDEQTGQKKFSEQTNQQIDAEINRIIQESYSKCRSLLDEKKDIIEKLAEELLKKETLALPEIVEILGPRPFPMKETLKDYLQELKDREAEDVESAKAEKEKEQQQQKDMAAAIKFDPEAVEELEKEESDQKEDKVEDAAETPADKMADQAKAIEEDAKDKKEGVDAESKDKETHVEDKQKQGEQKKKDE